MSRMVCVLGWGAAAESEGVEAARLHVYGDMKSRVAGCIQDDGTTGRGGVGEC